MLYRRFDVVLTAESVGSEVLGHAFNIVDDGIGIQRKERGLFECRLYVARLAEAIGSEVLDDTTHFSREVKELRIRRRFPVKEVKPSGDIFLHSAEDFGR